MIDTALTSTIAGFPAQGGKGAHSVAGTLPRLWRRSVVVPLHRALDSALRIGDLRELNAGTLADIGYRRD